MKFFSSNVKLLREQFRMTQAEIETRIGIERTTWGNYERGKSFPNLKLFHSIANFFGVPEDELLNVDLRSHPEKLGKILGPTLGPTEQSVILSELEEVTGRSIGVKMDSPKNSIDPELIWRDRYIQVLENKLLQQEAVQDGIAQLRAQVQQLEGLLQQALAGPVGMAWQQRHRPTEASSSPHLSEAGPV